MKRWMTKDIYAHRGYHDKPTIPENSLPAFKRAVARGWGAEFDVHLLRDGTLAVFHDSDLKRCTGEEGIIENLDKETLCNYRLEGTDEKIPLFDEVLEIFENSKNKNGKTCPLIIELKAYKGNHKKLAKAVCDRLDSYTGDFCIESFDPRAIVFVRKYRPEIIRGQLSMDFINHGEGLPRVLRRLLTNMLWNKRSDPDFVAYRFEDRHLKACRRAVDKEGRQEFSWTIRNKKDFDTVIAAGSIPIFEKFDPEE